MIGCASFVDLLRKIGLFFFWVLAVHAHANGFETRLFGRMMVLSLGS